MVGMVELLGVLLEVICRVDMAVMRLISELRLR